MGLNFPNHQHQPNTLVSGWLHHPRNLPIHSLYYLGLTNDKIADPVISSMVYIKTPLPGYKLSFLSLTFTHTHTQTNTKIQSIMALETERKTEAIFNSTPAQKQKDRILLLLRLVAFMATASATIVMALNKQTIALVVATVGNNPIKASLTAKFQHTPAFVLVLYSLLILSLLHIYNDCVCVSQKKKK